MSDKPHQLSLTGLIARSIGVRLWRSAAPASLPVRPPGAAEPASLSRGSTGIALVVSTVAILGIALMVLTSQALRRIQVSHIVPRDTRSLGDTRDAMIRESESWWRWVAPDASSRLRALADQVESGGGELRALAETYGTFQDKMDTSMPGRVLLGHALATPVGDAMHRVARPWHRQTLVYQEVDLHAGTYLGTPPGIGALEARVTLTPPSYNLVITVRNGTGELVTTSRRLQLGDLVTVPLRADHTVELAAWSRAGGGGLRQVEAVTFPLTSWPAGDIVFPQTELRFRVAFSDSEEGPAPRPRPLSEPAVSQLES